MSQIGVAMRKNGMMRQYCFLSCFTIDFRGWGKFANVVFRLLKNVFATNEFTMSTRQNSLRGFSIAPKAENNYSSPRHHFFENLSQSKKL